jgi:hypothetical protein
LVGTRNAWREGGERARIPKARQYPVTDLGRAARTLLAGESGDGDSSQQVAERAMQACERLVSHVSRLLGELGGKMLFERSVVVASADHPWLRSTANTEQPASATEALRAALEQQEPESIAQAFVAILAALIGLLKRLIGDGLVERLLNEVWPAVFVHEVKDTP